MILIAISSQIPNPLNSSDSIWKMGGGGGIHQQIKAGKKRTVKLKTGQLKLSSLSSRKKKK